MGRKNKRAKKQKAKKGTIEYNTKKIKKKYPLNQYGYFGKAGKGRARIVESDNQYKTAKDFYTKISKGGRESTLSNGHGVKKELIDRTTIIYRKETKTKDSPAVSLNIKKESKIKDQKIHFVRRKNNDK